MNITALLRIFLFSLAMVAASSLSRAEDCQPVLNQNLNISSQDSSSYYAYYNLIDTREEYSSQRSFSSSGDFLGLISGSANYEDYMERRSQQLSITSMNMESSYASKIIVSSVTADQVAAWRDCMSQKNGGLVLYLEDITDTAATIVLSWDPPADVPELNLTSAQATGISLPGSDAVITDIAFRFPQVFDGKNTTAIIVNRVNCGEMRVTVGIGNSADGILVPACPPTKSGPVETPPIQTRVFPMAGLVGNHPAGRSCLPQGWKLIGGGAYVDFGVSPGVLLTSSYPEGQCWKAEAKDHSVGASGTVTAFAIGLNDPNDQWIVEVFSEMGPVAPYPQALAAVPNNLTLTGCGGRINWSGNGNLLTGLFPSSGNTCSVFGKEHSVPNPSSATAYAIGIRPRNGAALPTSRVFNATGSAARRPNANVALPSICKISGGGAVIDWSGTPGVLLTSSMPTGNGWSASGKDHSVAASASIRVYVIGLCR